MKILFDGSVYEEENRLVGIDDRGLQYGDGLFETMYWNGEAVRNLDLHLKRLKKGTEILGLEVNEVLEPGAQEKKITSLIEENKLSGKLRIKWMIWRRPGGLYLPQTESFHELIKVMPYSPGPAMVRSADFADSIHLSYSQISPLKTISALPYVMAARECRERGLDDLILLSDRGKVAECLYANLFWGSGKELYTPSLQTGCIEGVRRKELMNILPDLGYSIEEAESHPEKLLMASYAFRTNANAIVPIHRIADRIYASVPQDILFVDRD
ncbi:aminotransferase class IV [Roseivirga sp. BDSF3-8]|uniref:aminotransferase class IV n=1 Tax=Roseivirga sp. BDSF3-8 TaxID=3241598 RepID=UPI003531E132